MLGGLFGKKKKKTVGAKRKSHIGGKRAPVKSVMAKRPPKRVTVRDNVIKKIRVLQQKENALRRKASLYVDIAGSERLTTSPPARVKLFKKYWGEANKVEMKWKALRRKWL